MSSQPQDFVWEVNWGEIAPEAPAAAPAVTTPPPAPVAAAPLRALVRGQRIKLAELGVGAERLVVGMQLAHRPEHPVDVTCLGLNAQGKLASDSYFVFYNQPASPCGGVALLGAAGAYTQQLQLDLPLLPASIQRLVLVAAMDAEGQGTMAALGASRLVLQRQGTPVAEFPFTGADFGPERVLIIAEIYRRQEQWVCQAAGQGFEQGLAALLRHYGAEVSG